MLKIPNGLFNEFLKNIEPIKSVINPIRTTSIEASKLYENESLDFVFIDAAHDYESIKSDIEHWYPKVKRGGYIAGDDYVWESINLAVKEYFFNKHNIITMKEFSYHNAEQTWIVHKS